jgi:hypothetical protein
MRRVGIIRGMGGSSSLRRLARLTRPAWTTLCLLAVAAPSLAAEPIAVFPATPYDGYLIYESLAVFWIALIGLIVIIRMKLKEIERTQALGADQEDDDAPLLK